MKVQAHLEFKSDHAKTVSVAGDFNDWCGSTTGKCHPERGKMTLVKKGHWVFPLRGVSSGSHQYKFIVDGNWEGGLNRTFFLDEKGRLIDPTGGVLSVAFTDLCTIRVSFSPLTRVPPLESLSFAIRPQGKATGKQLFPGFDGHGEVIELRCQGLDFFDNLFIEISGLIEGRKVIRPILVNELLDHGFVSFKPLGANVEGNPPQTVFRLFAPRARRVVLKRFLDPLLNRPIGEVLGWKDAQGIWEMRIDGTHWGTYYGFMVEGPHGEGEGFDPRRIWPDPYARAGHFHNGPSLLIDPEAYGNGFSGWTDSHFRTPPKSDLVVYEASIRDLTSHISSKVTPTHRGKFLGLVETVGKGTGIDHMKELGVSAVEFLPVQEFDDDPPGSYHWGYMTSLYFAPDASFALSPNGGQVNEFKAMVNSLHGNGLAVVLDVVYNHTGSPHVFMGLDKKYYYRHDADMNLLNYSGCGNDFRTESPMARRMIIDSLEYWMKECHVDGFRFDLGELIDLATLYEIERRLKAINPDVILILEPWSFRGSNKGLLKNTAWASWNDDFRNRIKDAAQGKVPVNYLIPVIKGTMEFWTATPWESVNYVESHDNFTLADHLSHSTRRDGTSPTPLELRQNAFCAALTILSPGIPMLAQGQEMLRSKKGNHNSYNSGDTVNKVDYRLKEKNAGIFGFYRDLIALRRSEAGRPIRESDARTCREAPFFFRPESPILGILFTTPDGRKSALILINSDHGRKQTIACRLPVGKWSRRVGDGRVFSTPSGSHRRIIVNAETDVYFDVGHMSVEYWVKD
jgi:pullulanase/glycogen debranching enzyme